MKHFSKNDFSWSLACFLLLKAAARHKHPPYLGVPSAGVRRIERFADEMAVKARGCVATFSERFHVRAQWLAGLSRFFALRTRKTNADVRRYCDKTENEYKQRNAALSRHASVTPS